MAAGGAGAPRLALAGGAGGAGPRLGEGTGRPLLDALPYADPLDTALRARAEALVQEEVRRPPPPPPPPPRSPPEPSPCCSRFPW